MTGRSSRLEGIESEFCGESLGDARLAARMKRIAARLAAAPSDSFPEQMSSVAEREALYRFVANPAVSLDVLLEGHVRQTHERIGDRATVRIVHDTTDFSFEGEREGLGIVTRGVRGFFAHVALAVGDDETREPLGVVGIRTHILDVETTSARRKLTKHQRVRQSIEKGRSDKLSSRWEKLAIEVSRTLPAHVHAIHVMDQEADDYALLAELQKADLSFVVRVSPGRRLHDGGPSLADALSVQHTNVFRAVAINARRAKAATRVHHVRRERDASLVVRWGSVTIRRGPRAQSDIQELQLHAVHVLEPNPPAGEEPVEWMLFTSERVESIQDATSIVDHYRARWIIEEYFKALKTGCAFEKRQLTTLEGLLRALGLFVPVAWMLLAVRHLGRAEPAAPATVFFDAEQLLLMRALLDQRRHKLPDQPTVRDAMLGIAALGGHIKQNGDPGWIVLGRGLMKLLDAEVGWRLARRSDQS